MKIKLFTYYYTNNYGALLQSLCLKSIIEENFDCRVEYNSYQQKDLIFKETYRPLITKYPSKFFKTISKNIQLSLWKKKTNLQKPSFKEKKIEKDESICIYGSDEIWNFKNAYFNFDLFFFGKNNKNIKISYAPSIGIARYENLDEIKKQLIKEELVKFKSISVRDSNTFDFVKKITGIKPQIVVDPTLLCTPKILLETNSTKIPRNKYALVYGTIFSTDQKKKIKKYCKDKNFKLVSVGYYDNWTDKNLINVNPIDFFQLFQKSQIVFTSMFHGIMFSVKLRKNFWYSEDPIRKNKISHFINELDLNYRRINKDKDFSEVIDYSKIYEKLDVWVQKSKEFLINNINQCLNDQKKN